MSRTIVFLSFAVFMSAVFFGNFGVRGQRPEPATLPNREIKPIAVESAKQMPRTQRIREGTVFKDMHVFFRQTNDRTVLYTVGDNRKYTCHENLTLERILNAMKEKPEREFWKVEGEFTEFRGENSVFLRRAVVAQAPSETPPIITP